MLSHRHMHLEVEMLKWLAVIGLAAAIALAMVSQINGAEAKGGPATPNLLPPDMEQLAQRLETTAQVPVSDDVPVPGGPSLAEELAQWNQQLWDVLELHRQGLVEEAIGAWAETPLPCETEVWRYVSLGVAYLQSGQLEEAADMLVAADTLEPDNAVVHYFTGILRLQQATEAREWWEPPHLPATLVSWTPLRVVPNTPSMYQLAAIAELEKTLELAPYLQRDQMLIAPEWGDMESQAIPRLPAIVDDVLRAIGADNFEGKAHNMLGELSLQRDWLVKAESHMDAAAQSGLSIVYGYEDLADRYEAEGQHLDAFRVCLKQVAQGGEIVEPARRAYENLRKSLLDLF
jgi:tetratricopeptide (TPR) repeat protein